MQVITTTSQAPRRVIAVDEANGNLTYLGFAKIGTATSTAGWQILRIQKTGSVTLIQYANGSPRFNQIWDDRASLVYSN